VEFVEGYFNETLPTLRGRPWSVVRLDGDTYEATWVGLDSLYPGLSAGGYLIIDDYGLIPECHAAVHDFRREHEITEPIEKIDFNGIRWRKESAPDPSALSGAGPPRRAPMTRSAQGENDERGHIPTERELELEREVRELRERLDAVSEAGSEGAR
jgi:hypothetical protein